MISFTPVAPMDVKGNFRPELLEKAEQVLVESARLAGTHTPQLLQSLRDLLRIVNSYYSNKIESEGTHPANIEKAMKKEYAEDETEWKMQMLSVAYIKTQEEIEQLLGTDTPPSPYSKTFILDIHKRFYTKEGMEPFLHVKHEELEATMIPGTIRDQNVQISKHLAPLPGLVGSLMNEYEHLYGLSLSQRPSLRLIYALAAHHRLTWIHPFLDGNGRTARLALDGALLRSGMKGYGLWNISRGLARRNREYREHLRYADMVRQGDRDGRGALSMKALEQFVMFMMDMALDQIEYMGKYLRLNEFSKRMDIFIEKADTGMIHGVASLPKYSDMLFRHLLLSGECARGEVKKIIGKSDRTATSLISELTKQGYVTSDIPKGPIRLVITSAMASFLFPQLYPDL